ncbi:SCO2583 family membrane protein [Streptomyces sp. NPDC000229]|uniref:SCO2583 family membrane protein n=1 Tax=Streptomyces sp. NPDC000229 TaxID=3154247 RepID=UPI003322FC47
MAGRGDPPEGTPEGLPGGGEDEYRSVVFDESFVRAARLQEYSAQERMGEHAQAVRSRPEWGSPSPGSRPRHGALVLVLVVAVVFAAVVYLSARNTYQPLIDRRAEPLRITVVPLAPRGTVPGGDPATLYAHSPAAQFRSGAAGITLPAAKRTAHFSESQVVTALSTVKDYLVQSSLDPDVLTGEAVRQVRLLLDPDQLGQFDRSVESPADDGWHAATGWLVRFDTAEVALADTTARVRGTMRVAEVEPDLLEVTSDHTLVYAVRPAGTGADADASLFTVRRELAFRFDREDLRMHRAELLTSRVQAGPQSCSADPAGSLHPVLAGHRSAPAGPALTDPYAIGTRTTALCGALSPAAQPSPPGR